MVALRQYDRNSTGIELQGQDAVVGRQALRFLHLAQELLKPCCTFAGLRGTRRSPGKPLVNFSLLKGRLLGAVDALQDHLLRAQLAQSRVPKITASMLQSHSSPIGRLSPGDSATQMAVGADSTGEARPRTSNSARNR